MNALRAASRAALLGALVFAGGLQAQHQPASVDAAITAGVERALDGDRMLRRMDIAVQTHGAVVSLTGFVRSLDDIVRAGALAGEIDGVAGVRNALRVANQPSRAGAAAARTPA